MNPRNNNKLDGDDIEQQVINNSFAGSYSSQGQPLSSQTNVGSPQGNAQAAPEVFNAAMEPGFELTKKPMKVNANSTQNALKIAEIRDGIVIMSDGTFRSVVMVKAINFDLMSPQEKESVEYAYQGFLNSLYFPIQIFIHSEKVDIKPYIDRLDKIRSEQDNMLLALLMDDYLNFIVGLADQTNIMDKSFYVVIPYSPLDQVQENANQTKNFISAITNIFSPKEKHVVINESALAQAKEELRNRVQSILGGLAQANIQGLPLDTQELIELYYNTYNPDTAIRQRLKDFDDLIAPIVDKGTGLAAQPDLDRELTQ
jgi:hypothetical protein